MTSAIACRMMWSVALAAFLGLSSLVACEKGAGRICYAATECGEGLACLGENGIRRCESCDGSDLCRLEGRCDARSGVCSASTDEQCESAFVCTGKGGCTARDGRCVVGGDADCKQSDACRERGFCTAKGNDCTRRPEG